MQFNNELHKQLFALFIAESNSATYRLWEWDTNVKMIELIGLIMNEYENFWEDRGCANE